MSSILTFATLSAVADRGTPSSVSLKDGLEACRARHKLKKQQFAALIGMPGPHYSELIGDKPAKRQMTLNQARRAHAIGVPADVILQGPNTK